MSNVPTFTEKNFIRLRVDPDHYVESCGFGAYSTLLLAWRATGWQGDVILAVGDCFQLDVADLSGAPHGTIWGVVSTDGAVVRS